MAHGHRDAKCSKEGGGKAQCSRNDKLPLCPTGEKQRTPICVMTPPNLCHEPPKCQTCVIKPQICVMNPNIFWPGQLPECPQEAKLCHETPNLCHDEISLWGPTEIAMNIQFCREDFESWGLREELIASLIDDAGMYAETMLLSARGNPTAIKHRPGSTSEGLKVQCDLRLGNSFPSRNLKFPQPKAHFRPQGRAWMAPILRHLCHGRWPQ